MLLNASFQQVPAEINLKRDKHLNCMNQCTVKIGSLVVSNSVILDYFGVQRSAHLISALLRYATILEVMYTKPRTLLKPLNIHLGKGWSFHERF